MSKTAKPNWVQLIAKDQVAVHLRATFGADYSAQPLAPAGEAGLRNGQALQETPAALMGGDDFANPADTQPQESDFIMVNFLALSAAVTRPEMSGMVLDLTTPGVLEAAAPKMAGKAVSKNHWDYDVESFYGVVSQSAFAADGAGVGVPGIKAQLKISRRIAPKLVYGLLMEPPAINAVSAKLFIKFEFSHPALAEEVGFWGYVRRNGEEIDGQVVRLIVTEIVDFGRLSFVDRGADTLNQRLPDDEFDDEDLSPVDDLEAEAGKKKTKAGMASQEPKGETTLKLKPEVRAALGLQGDDSTDFAESAVLGALPSLTTKAALGAQLLEGLRERVKAAALRVAMLTHKGDGQPTLGTVDELLIKKADAEELALLQTSYEEKLTANLSATCQNCGARVTSLRSSVGSAPEQDAELAEDEFAVTLM